LRCPWRDIRHAARDGGEGRRGADGYPNAKGVPCDVPPVLMKGEGWGERDFVKWVRQNGCSDKSGNCYYKGV